MVQTRFQPRLGRLLAAAAKKVVSIFDIETETCIHSLQRHTKPVHSVCWDVTGDYVASVSEDSVRVWALGSGGDGECVHELSCNGNKFHSCVFHPDFPSLLVIGCYQVNTSTSSYASGSISIRLIGGLSSSTLVFPFSEGVYGYGILHFHMDMKYCIGHKCLSNTIIGPTHMPLILQLSYL
ncbi:hypothetical protein O6H91_06G112100 [Diphasiastrum complanatum]|uniref:Uncharacterized protein n=1 Tax=Diphasiastrum complanatum TaxID=34168 RepID=A0ACC2DHG2_DIPCM|nr:hypothetical protein O6H91_06G112100 [Diphasiastrum complanatum]